MSSRTVQAFLLLFHNIFINMIEHVWLNLPYSFSDHIFNCKYWLVLLHSLSPSNVLTESNLEGKIRDVTWPCNHILF